jgi:hypothetical protein
MAITVSVSCEYLKFSRNVNGMWAKDHRCWVELGKSLSTGKRAKWEKVWNAMVSRAAADASSITETLTAVRRGGARTYVGAFICSPSLIPSTNNPSTRTLNWVTSPVPGHEWRKQNRGFGELSTLPPSVLKARNSERVSLSQTTLDSQNNRLNYISRFYFLLLLLKKKITRT